MSTAPRHAFLHSSALERYHYPPQSPFKTHRAALTKAVLLSMDLYVGDTREEVPPTALTEDELLLYHTRPYIDALKRASAGELEPSFVRMGLGIGDCPVFPDLYEYATLAAGASVTGARLVLGGATKVAFNPSGGYHHAKAAEAGGFCYINDIVLACKVLTAAGKRVFCLDLDAHHGNGTQDAFYDDPAVLTMSFHESGRTLYPWGGFEDEIGEGPGRGYNVNVPMPAGMDDDVFFHSFRDLVPPLIKAYRPDVIVVELGMDILSVDPLVHLKMTNNAIADVLPLLKQFDKPMVVTGGGGYNPESTARGWALAWTVLTGIQPDADMAMGMGGVFLGSSEWSAGLRDKRIYTSGEQRKVLVAEMERVIAAIRGTVFPIHGIADA